MTGTYALLSVDVVAAMWATSRALSRALFSDSRALFAALRDNYPGGDPYVNYERKRVLPISTLWAARTKSGLKKSSRGRATIAPSPPAPVGAPRSVCAPP